MRDMPLKYENVISNVSFAFSAAERSLECLSVLRRVVRLSNKRP